MIDPERYYTAGDSPSPEARKAMWETIHSRILRTKPSRLFALDRRSFAYGMVASFIIIFSGIGLYTSVRNAIEFSQPEIIKLDKAYQSAIREFEKVAFVSRAHTVSDDTPGDAQTVRKQQLTELEAAIDALRAETRSGDISPMKRTRLRELYSKKLNVLQEMLEQGDIEL